MIYCEYEGGDHSNSIILPMTVGQNFRILILEWGICNCWADALRVK